MSRAAHFTFSRLPAAQQATVTQQVLAALAAHGLDPSPAADTARACLRAAEVLRAQELSWANQRRGGASRAVAEAPSGAPELGALDGAVDGLLGRLYRKLEGDVLGYGRDAPEGEQAERLLNALFPSGLAAHVQAPYMSQVQENARVVATLESSAWAAEVADLRLAPLRAPLRAAVEAFDAAYRASLAAPEAGPSFDDLRSGAAEAHEGMLLLYMRLSLEIEARPELHSALLGPLLLAWEQNRRRRSHHRSGSADAEGLAEAGAAEGASTVGG